MTIRRQSTSFSTTSSSSFAEAHDLLFNRMEQLVRNSTENSNPSKCRLVVAVAGGGTSFASTLAATTGASQILLEAVTCYDRESFLDFTSSTAIQQSQPSEFLPKFQFASMTAAQMAATAALQRSLQLTVGSMTCARPSYRPLQYMPYTVGLACASQLVSSSTANIPATTLTSQAHIVAQLPHGSSVQMTCSIPAALSRREQDIQVAHSMLTCLKYALQLREDCWNSKNEKDATAIATRWKERMEQSSVTNSNDDGSLALEWREMTNHGEERQVRIKTIIITGCPVLNAAQSVVDGRESIVMLIPQQEQYRVVQGSVATLPPHSLIVPGSFNPPHAGHVQLAMAALQVMKEKQSATVNPVIWFELSLANADKPALEPQAAVDRVQLFTNLLPEGQEWGILLTNAPLFAQKIHLLDPMAGRTSRNRNDSNSDDNDQLTFCIGTDTLVRLLDPKYYQDSCEQMLATLEQLPCRFVAGGRVDPKQPGVFVTGEAALAELPPHVASKFTLLPEFRVDISSTELRRQREMEQHEST